MTLKTWGKPKGCSPRWHITYTGTSPEEAGAEPTWRPRKPRSCREVEAHLESDGESHLLRSSERLSALRESYYALVNTGVERPANAPSG
jgi:hypothetical protein